MANFEKLNETNSIVLTVDDIVIKTTQKPYLSDCGNFYKAHAINIFGGEYEVTWGVADQETPDWHHPMEVIVTA